MSEKYTFAILGGDRRQTVIARTLIDRGHSVRLYGIDNAETNISGVEMFFNPDKAVGGSDFVLFPLPASRDGIHLNIKAETNYDSPMLSDIIRCAACGKCRAVLGGLIPKQTEEFAALCNIPIFDYYKNAGLQIKNASPSAEGAIMLAMENTEMMIDGMKVVVCGYGRIGSLLAHKLKSLGADVTVMARRDESLCEIVMNGYHAIRIDEKAEENIAKSIDNCDVVFNTVPNIVFTKRIISMLKSKPIYIEIASSPGGIDLSAARDHGIETVFAPSIPGRYAPINAGIYIFETILEILQKRGIEI